MTSVAVDTVKPSPLDALLVLQRALKLSAFTRHAEEIAIKASRDGWTFSQYFQHLPNWKSKSAGPVASIARFAIRTFPRRKPWQPSSVVGCHSR